MAILLVCAWAMTINLARVRDLRPLADGAWRVTLDSGAELVVSRSYRDGFLARLARAGSSGEVQGA